MRIDSFDQDKDIRDKYMLLKGVSASEFGIDPYLSMNDAGVFFKEALKKFGMRDFTTEKKESDSSMMDRSLINTTVQMNDGASMANEMEIANIGFRQYLSDHKGLLQSLPPAARQQIMLKAKVRPF